MAPSPPSAGLQGMAARFVSGVVLVALALVADYLGGMVFAVVAGALGVLLLIEWFRLTGGRGLLAGLAALAALWLAIVLQGNFAAAFYVLAMGAIGTAVFCLMAGDEGRAPWAGAGVVYVGVPVIALLWMRAAGEAGSGAIFVLWLFLVVWATDIAAYAFGKALGRRKLAPAVSPGKTWEGLFGGAAVSLLVTLVLLVPMGAFALAWVPVILVLVAVSVFGDLFESVMKRARGVKDSGALLPGHGGALDRIDSVVAALPVFALILTQG